MPRGAADGRSETQAGESPDASGSLDPGGPLIRKLDEWIEAAMTRHHIPGVAVGVLYRGEEYLRGYGVTNVDYPQPVDENTLFRIGSTTKTFTGTTIMRLVEQGRLDLKAPVRSYLPGLELADSSAAARVTVGQLLNHTAGWLGDDYANTGRGENALARYVTAMKLLPQLTPPGEVFAYNNAAVNLAGYLISVITGRPYEEVIRTELLEPLGLTHTGFFSDALVGYSFAASHIVEDGRAMVEPAMWRFPESLHPTGGLISSARDQLRYARFHLGDGVWEGAPLLSPRSIQAMRTAEGPGGAIQIEIEGVGVNWWRRRTAEGVPVFQHGGSWQGQYSGFFFVPEREFAMTMLTNSTGGPRLIHDLFFTDRVLRDFAGLSDPPAEPEERPQEALAPYEGRYRALIIPPTERPLDLTGTDIGTGDPPELFVETSFEMTAADGGLQARSDDMTLALKFYADEKVLATDDDGQVHRSDFIRGDDGRILWFRDGGRLFARMG